MKHQSKGWRKLAKHGQAWNMLRTMVTQLITHERIKTTRVDDAGANKIEQRATQRTTQSTSLSFE